MSAAGAVSSLASVVAGPMEHAHWPRVAVLIPCFNEATTIGKVVSDFRRALPDALIAVYDNNSSDRSVELAEMAGAAVLHESAQGKGHVVRRLFADIDADVYVLVDADDTYDAEDAPRLVQHLLNRRLDIVNCRRISTGAATYGPGTNGVIAC